MTDKKSTEPKDAKSLPKKDEDTKASEASKEENAPVRPRENEVPAEAGSNQPQGKQVTGKKDTGFFNSKDMAYANLPKSDEPVTGGPYDPTVQGPDKDGQIPNQASQPAYTQQVKDGKVVGYDYEHNQETMAEREKRVVAQDKEDREMNTKANTTKSTDSKDSETSAKTDTK
jgi:hypothetical protein